MCSQRAAVGAALALGALVALCTSGRFVDAALVEQYKRDWTESPLLGQGEPPPGVETDVYLSIYVDRLLEVNEKDYTFHASLEFFMSWTDKRAPAAVTAATAAAAAPGGSCARYCSYSDELHGTGDACCGGDLWLPSLRFRNVASMSGSRNQVFYITVRPDGVVIWRVKLSAVWFCNMDFHSFPFDMQTLDIHLYATQGSLSKGPAGTNVKFIASATGDRLFDMGEGSDSNGWDITNLFIFQSRHSYASQFSLKHNFRRSARADPAPLVPSANDSLVTMPFGDDIMVNDIVAAIVVQRQWPTYVLSTIVPVIVVVMLALSTYLLDSDATQSRMSTAQTLFLTLVAVSWVSEGFTPKASYPLPTRGLLMLSYAVLITIALETCTVLSIRNGIGVAQRARRVRQGRDEYVAVVKRRLRWRWRQATMRRRRHAGGGEALPTTTNGDDGDDAPAAMVMGGTNGIAPIIVPTAKGGSPRAGPSSPPPPATLASSGTPKVGDDARVSFREWLADLIDMCTFFFLVVGYALGAALIFIIAKARQPDACSMSGAPRGCMDQLGRA